QVTSLPPPMKTEANAPWTRTSASVTRLPWLVQPPGACPDPTSTVTWRRVKPSPSVVRSPNVTPSSPTTVQPGAPFAPEVDCAGYVPGSITTTSPGWQAANASASEAQALASA